MRLQVGAPGLYPPQTIAPSAGVAATLPPIPISSDATAGPRRYEIRAVGKSGEDSWARWIDVEIKKGQSTLGFSLSPAGALEIEVRGADGQPVVGASVRLSRHTVGLLSETEMTSSAGMAVFEGVPAGDYRVHVSAPGFIRQSRHLLKTRAPSQRVAFRLQTGATLTGVVLDEARRPVPGARVRLFPSSPFAPDNSAHVAATEPGVWSRETLTGLDGQFIVSGLPPRAVRVGAHADGFVPTLSAPIRVSSGGDGGHIEVVLARGRDLTVHVVDSQGSPLAGISVHWGSLVSAERGLAQTDSAGTARLSGVAPGALVWAQLGDWTSPRANIPQEGRVEIVAERTAVEIVKLLELDHAGTVDVTSIRVDAGGHACRVNRVSATMWQLRACPAGPGRVFVQTVERGSHTFETRIEDSTRIRLPAPQTLKVTLSGLGAREWTQAVFHWEAEGGPPRAAPLTPTPGDGKATWSRDLLPGRYELRVGHPSAETATRTIVHGPSASHHHLALERLSTVEVFVVDAQGGAVEGAVVQAWSGAQMLAEGQSLGAEPLALSIAARDEVSIFAIDPRRGESIARWSRSEPAEELVLSLDSPLLTHATPPGRLRRRAQIEAELEAPLVEDGDALLIDAANPASKARRAGVARGDALLWLRRDGARLWVAASRPDGAIVEVELP